MNNFEIYQQFIKNNQFAIRDEFFDSKEYFDLIFSSDMNWDLERFRNKLYLFCPSFVYYLHSLNQGRVGEFLSGFGLFCRVVKQSNPRLETFFLTQRNSNSAVLAELTSMDYVTSICEIGNCSDLDVLFSDSSFNYFTDVQIEENINIAYNLLKKNGLFLLLIDLNTEALRNDFDLIWIHKRISETGFICTLGKNTFCSLWIKK